MVAEARSADEPLLTRRCVIMKVPDFTTEKYLQAQRQNAAAVLILMPKNISSVPQESIQVTSRTERPAADHKLFVKQSVKTHRLCLLLSPSW